MKPNSLYAELELIVEPTVQSPRSEYSLGHAWAVAKTRLAPMATALLAYLCGSTDLRVTVRCDRGGNSLYVVYDPVTQQRHTFSSEADLRAWADRRYYQ
ncbi:MAG TPA: hypothetical protein VLS96_08495 [Nodosilinea sp.]|nr:hypothetical protein [Nodosilinea sp.]